MRIGILLTALAVLASAVPVQAQSRWINGSNGYLPPNAFQGGHEADGKPLYVCRAEYRDGVHIGKFRADWKGCNIPWGGREIIMNNYQVLVR